MERSCLRRKMWRYVNFNLDQFKEILDKRNIQIIIEPLFVQQFELLMIHFLDVVVKVAIIGAGISGIGSSVTLSNNSVQHIIIEARNRTGGRITSMVFDGVTIQLGAEFIHNADSSDEVANVIRNEGWNYTDFTLQLNQFFYKGQRQLTQSEVNESYAIYDNVCAEMIEEQAATTKPLDLKSLTNNYFKKLTNHSQQVIDAAQWSIKYFETFNGAQLKDLGVSQCQYVVDADDIYPNRGYSQLLQYIFSKATPKAVYLNQKVNKIDYSGDIVKIYTDSKKVYLANKVISSFPLGVLKSNDIQFVPKLSKERKAALKAMGNGIFNKIFVSFDAPFWDVSKQWLNFVGQSDYVNKYSVGEVIPGQGKFILAFFTRSDQSIKISKMTDIQIRADILAHLKYFFPNTAITIRDLKATRWHEDPLTKGSYSFKSVGTIPSQLMQQYCSPLDNKVFFVGEHCHPVYYSYSNAGYKTGIWAAQKITDLFNS